MVQSLDRALDVLETLAEADEDLSVSQLTERLGLPLGTVHRLLGSLAARGYAAQDRATRRYGPGPRLLEVAARAAGSRRFSLARVAIPSLQRLTDATGETSNLLLLQGREAAYSEQVSSPHMVRLFTEVGQRVPLYCTGGGKAILSGMGERDLEAYLAEAAPRAWTPKTISSLDGLRADVQLSARRGFAIDDEERDLGVCCVAAPIFDRQGRCVAALSISGPSTRLSAARAAGLGPMVRAEADACSAAMGFAGTRPGEPHGRAQQASDTA
ncbi:IclR family transcriptional regulator [Oscillochloris sp. ZM17-4]|uniref:IclR family transcriptional regulator n=1 Tax=Oscillochloris sp. ZM17-4 TaxID=2866714 RepID=UPI001C73601E|nr:IclR family transcriptional regulator [Oscillochloris sp. ZM17-4]MBX0329463.1 IclR family transcriptional regulator [Oscillochloris sp. ZM17-4]